MKRSPSHPSKQAAQTETRTIPMWMLDIKKVKTYYCKSSVMSLAALNLERLPGPMLRHWSACSLRQWHVAASWLACIWQRC